MIDLARAFCSDQAIAERQEWLVTNGRGGFACGTVAGLLTRRYHGLLIAALDPPLGRTLLVAALDEAARYDEASYALGAHRWHDGSIAPHGFVHLDGFRLDGTVPVWTYACGDALLEKRVWMEHGAPTTYVRYTLRRARAPLTLEAKALVNYRTFHGTTRAGDWPMDVTPVDHGVRVTAFDGATPYALQSATADVVPSHTWYRDVLLQREAERGLDAQDDHLHAATLHATLKPGASCTLVLSTEADALLDGQAALQRQHNREQALLDRAAVDPADAATRQLVLAADAFIVERPTPAVDDGHSVIAGYPWFGDWGRDTMIALPGLTLATGRPGVAARILRTFARFVDGGMLPNRFPDAGDAPEYNTVDATLWFFEAIRAYHAATTDEALLADLFPTLASIMEAHRRGTRHGIRVDPADGLLRAGAPGVQLTWMDAKVDDWVVTPRIGKPVEVNALWYHALRCMTDFARVLDADPAPYADAADRAEAHFDRFWQPERGYLFDVVDGPEGDDARLRPNQLLAASLEHSPLPADRQRAVVDACTRDLLTPHGLRSLAPHAPDYHGRYTGDRRARDGAYHQGTVWSWLIGPFVAAHLRVYDDPALARTYLDPLLRHLSDHGLGSISEIFDGDAPFTPRGCFAQAWGVAQLLEALQRVEAAPPSAL